MVVGLSNAQNVEIPDTAFLSALIDEGVDTNGDGFISYDEAEAVTSIDIEPECNPWWCEGDITSLVGIEAFVNLNTLSLWGNQIDSLDLSNNTALTYLDCSDNQLTSLNVSGCTALYFLDCSDNQLTSLNVSGCTALYDLNCSDNDSLNSLDVSGCTAITYLNCSSSALTNLYVSGCTALYFLDCLQNQLTSLNVSGCTALHDLNISENQLISLDLSNNKALRYLRCNDIVSLYKVCVWETFFSESVSVDTDGSPNVYFRTECYTTMNKYIRFGSTGDPLNGLTVTWNNKGTSESIAWGYTTNHEEGVYHGLMRDGICGSMFDYTFPSLKAASTIHYSIFNSKDSTWTEDKTFNTASDASNNQFSFTILGDSRTNPDEWQNIYEATLDTDFTLFIGDIVADGSSASDWEACLKFGEEFISREPIYLCVGDYDYGGYTSNFESILGLFTLPGNELYYSFNYGNAVFICLNSPEAWDTKQYYWLLSTLEANKDQTWKILFFHMPFYSSPTNVGIMDDHLNTWWKSFDDYGVDMIFNGHTHNYQRTKPINRNMSKTSPVAIYGSGEGEGRCQIVSGSAGAPLSEVADASLWWLDNSASKYHFCNIDIDGDVLTFKAMDANRVVFDELVLDKTTGISDFRSTNSWVYPNPASNLLTIELTVPRQHTIEITSLNGQLIYSTKDEGPTHQIDLSSFRKGLYFITVRSVDYVKTEKIIKF